MKLLAFFLVTICSTAWSFDHNHETYRYVLSAFVLRNGNQTLVNYKDLKGDTAKLDQYIKELGEITKKDLESWNTDQKLATLINGYNAWTLKLITTHYPVKSIRKIGPFYSTPWKQEFITWLGQKVSLDHIEHEIIRKDFKEPRIHFALVCAAVSCPPLQEKPFLASTLEAQLKKGTDEFLLDQKKNTYVIKDEEVILSVSSIFDWYGSDFGNKDELRAYLVSQMGIAEKVKGKSMTIKYLDYDWSLNEVK